MSNKNTSDETFTVLRLGFRPIIPGEILDACSEARRIEERALEEARRIVEGKESKVRDAVTEAVREEEKRIGAAGALLLVEAKDAAEAYAEARKRDMADAVIAVAERVWGDLGTSRGEAARKIALELDRELKGSRRARFRVAPSDLERMDGLGINVVGDPSLESGDCVAEVDGCLYDARSTVRARLAVAALAEALGCRASEVEEHAVQ